MGRQGGGEAARLGTVAGEEGKGNNVNQRKKRPWPCLLPGELESLQIKSSGKAKVIMNSSTLGSYS